MALALGILGGVFDPPHVGHVALARAALDRLGLERLLVLVVADPGHKVAATPAETRLELTRLALADVPEATVELDDHARTVDSLAIRGREVLVLLLVRVLVTAFGVAAGLALRRHHARAVGLAKVSLLLSGATELFIVLTPSFPNSRGPGETPIWVAGILIYFGGWLAYLMRSPDPEP